VDSRGPGHSPEKRKVDSSILSLTTHYYQRICVRQLRKRRHAGRPVAVLWRPFETAGARRGPMLSARGVHGRLRAVCQAFWMQTSHMEVGEGRSGRLEP
jgi:hypothetical protein